MFLDSGFLGLDPVTRRGFLSLSAIAVPAATGAVGASIATQGFAATPLDFSDPFTNLYNYLKMVSTFAEEPVFMGHTGVFYAKVGAKMTPLFGYAGVVLQQARVAGDAVEVRGKESTVYMDLASGEPLETWDNPFTGETVEVVNFVNRGLYAKLGTRWPSKAFSGAESNAFFGSWSTDLTVSQDISGTVESVEDADVTKPFLLPWSKAGNQYLVGMNMHLRTNNPITQEGWPKASSGPIVETNETLSYFVHAEELEDPDAPSAQFSAGFARSTPWMPFMRMGESGVEGSMFAMSHTYKAMAGIDDVPRGVVAYLEKNEPGQLEPYTEWAPAPGEFPSSWTYYAETVEPEVAGYTRP